MYGRKGAFFLVPAEMKRGMEDVANNVGAVVVRPDSKSDGDIRAILPS